jgi:ZIP family zinc transporter
LLIAITFHNTANTGAITVICLVNRIALSGTDLGQHTEKPPIKGFLGVSDQPGHVFDDCRGSVVGMTVLPLLPDTAIDLILSFGLAALLFLVTEELLVEAHRKWTRTYPPYCSLQVF